MQDVCDDTSVDCCKYGEHDDDDIVEIVDDDNDDEIVEVVDDDVDDKWRFDTNCYAARSITSIVGIETTRTTKSRI